MLYFLPVVLLHNLKKIFDENREAAWAITNMTISGKKEQIELLVQNNVIEPMCELLAVKDVQVIQVVLDGLMNILKMAGKDYLQVCFVV